MIAELVITFRETLEATLPNIEKLHKKETI